MSLPSAPASLANASLAASLAHAGWAQCRPALDPALREAVRAAAFTPDVAGTRCLLDLPEVAAIAHALRTDLVAQGVLPSAAVAIQAIAFDKTATTNWKVTWHQDLMFPISSATPATGYGQAVEKHGVAYARPPVAVLARLLAVRLHLDDCHAANGPLRVAPGTHRHGVVPAAQLTARVATAGEHTCLAPEGDALLLRPLLLHASSPAQQPGHRRVLHVVFDTGEPVLVPWHRAL